MLASRAFTITRTLWRMAATASATVAVPVSRMDELIARAMTRKPEPIGFTLSDSFLLRADEVIE
jgi:hypothetical protein